MCSISAHIVRNLFIDSQVTQGRCPHCEEALGTFELEKTHNSREMEAFTPLMEHTELGLLCPFLGNRGSGLIQTKPLFPVIDRQV